MKELKLAGDKISLVDDDIYEWVSKYHWHVDNKGYARRGTYLKRKLSKWIFLHEMIIPCPKGMMRDHIDGNRLNNCRSNLRIVTHQQNNQNRGIGKRNTSGYKGIFLEAKRWWRAFITVNGKKTHLGYYPTAEDAARAYDEAAKKYYGEYARTNF